MSFLKEQRLRCGDTRNDGSQLKIKLFNYQYFFVNIKPGPRQAEYVDSARHPFPRQGQAMTAWLNKAIHEHGDFASIHVVQLQADRSRFRDGEQDFST